MEHSGGHLALKSRISFDESWNMKSEGNRLALRFTALFRFFVATP
jgi:hypothetical protein